MVSLYNKYREEAYTDLRDFYEPGYRARNAALQEPIIYTAQVEAFLEPWLQFPLTILDWGGDTGLNTPFRGKHIAFDVYDISDKELQDGARFVTLEQASSFKYKLIVCAMLLEHVPYPSDVLLAARHAMDNDSILYIEVPYEDIMRVRSSNIELNKKHWHEHVNFYSKSSLEAVLSNCGLRVVAQNILITHVGGSEVHIFQVACKLGERIRFSS